MPDRKMHGNRERPPFVVALDWFRGRNHNDPEAKNAQGTLAGALHAEPAMIDVSSLAVAAISDPGCVRELNEDSFQVVRSHDDAGEAELLAVVCDGMGGHAAGEIASGIAVETIVREWRAVADPVESLKRSIGLANRAILVAAAARGEFAGMGTTVVAVIIRGGMAWCAHVGDSRCYLLRSGELFLMTEDHSAVMDLVRKRQITADAARHHPDKNVINRALGVRKEVEVSVWPQPFRLHPDDQLLLCSDGLYDVLEDAEMQTVLNVHGAEEASRELVSLARERGAPDNVTAIILSANAIMEAGSKAVPIRTTRESHPAVPGAPRAAGDVA